jgi:uncharacterized membrane protein YdjX (TVP38/TMEM64 family)
LASTSNARRYQKIALVLAVLLALGAAKWLGVFEKVGKPALLAKSLVDLGGWGYLAFILAYAALQPFGVPGTVFVFAAPLIWPWPVAFALSMVGTMAASVIGFSFARFLARDWIEPRIPERFRRYDDALGRRALLTVFTLRFVFWMPPPLHYFFGISKVSGWTHFWGSLAGYLIPLFLVSYFGQKVVDLVWSAPTWVWIAASVSAALVVAIVIVVRWRTRSRAAE